MTAPSPADLRTWSKVPFDTLVGTDNEVLQVLIDRAVAWFETITGRPLDSMPTQFEAMTQMAVQRMVELAAYQRQPDQIETIADFLVISSFSTDGYSETRRSLEEIQKAKMISGDPYLNGLLLGLLTPDQYDWWLQYWSGVNAPAFEVTEVAWGLAGGGYSNSGVPITGATRDIWSL